MVTKEQLAAGMSTVIAVTEAIKDLGRVPSGHLYAAMCSSISLPVYEQIIGLIVGTGLVQRSGDELVWVGA